MCGRFEQQIGPTQSYELLFALGIATTRSNAGTAPTIRPTDHALVVTQSEAIRATFGLQRPGRPLLLNARSETLSERPTFRRLLDLGRAIVPLSGFYESGPRGPTLFRARAASTATAPLLLATALFDASSDSFVIVTQPADEVVAPTHSRMPVLVGTAGAKQWLAHGTFVPEHIALEVHATTPPASARRGAPDPLFEQGRLD
ncbi:SOS response-associated peptidase family protein [Ferrimicrobium sp.]|uniref:SOS response-associated peptidase family protein n=1 Tax=Ferrimicrobium sp. TaxID=2926050 RepID=UPI002609AC48|nr:SOS response-associated peptidase family protein [Ferrimicrobium sp.]